MRKLTIALITAIAAVMAPTAAAQVAQEDSVSGTGTFNELFPGEPQILSIIDARSGPSGEHPSGELRGTFGISLGRITLSVNVTCLTVTGHTALVSGLATGDGHSLELVAAVEDNAGTGQPDRVNALFRVDPLVLESCPSPFPGPFDGTLYPLITGDFTVHDAAPLPTSKDQCKNGGWRDFGVFKNQGDCVSFVATGDKNPPSGATD